MIRILFYIGMSCGVIFGCIAEYIQLVSEYKLSVFDMQLIFVYIMMSLGVFIYNSYLLFQIDRLIYRIALIILIVVAVYSDIILFATIYRSVGLTINGIFEANPDPFSCIYFSIVTWTTLGYGDIVPVGFGRFFAATEAIIGYLFMALLIAGLTKILDSHKLR